MRRSKASDKIYSMSTERNRPIPQQIYKHFKGNLYQINCIAVHSESGEEMVVYQALYGDFRFYVRPLSMFMEKVDKIKYPNVTQEYRFELISVADNDGAFSHESVAAKCIADEIGNKGITDAVAVRNADNSGETALGESVIAADMDNKPETSEEILDLDNDVIRFLDADTYEQRLEILTGMKYKITDDMIDIMSTVIDIEVCSGDINKRYEDFKSALMTRKHYEGHRLR